MTKAVAWLVPSYVNSCLAVVQWWDVHAMAQLIFCRQSVGNLESLHSTARTQKGQ